MKTLSAHITFYHNPSRLEKLNSVIDALIDCKQVMIRVDRILS